MYNFTINDGKENHTIVEVPDEVGAKLLQDARAASKYAKLYEFAPGDICIYTNHRDTKNMLDEEKYFCLTKVWFEDIGEGFFNAIYPDGCVLADGSLELITRVGHVNASYHTFVKDFKNEIIGARLYE